MYFENDAWKKELENCQNGLATCDNCGNVLPEEQVMSSTRGTLCFDCDCEQ